MNYVRCKQHLQKGVVDDSGPSEEHQQPTVNGDIGRMTFNRVMFGSTGRSRSCPARWLDPNNFRIIQRKFIYVRLQHLRRSKGDVQPALLSSSELTGGVIEPIPTTWTFVSFGLVVKRRDRSSFSSRFNTRYFLASTKILQSKALAMATDRTAAWTDRPFSLSIDKSSLPWKMRSLPMR